MCGDAREPASWSKLLEGERANIVFTSPPYASQRKYDEASGFKPIPPDEYGDWWAPLQSAVRSHLADDGSFFVNIKEHCEDGVRHIYCKELLIRHVREWGWRWIEEYCWPHGGTPREVINRFKNGWEPVWHLVPNAEFAFRPNNVRHAYKPDQTGTRVESYGGGRPCGADGIEKQRRTAALKAIQEERPESFKFRLEAVRHEIDAADIPDWTGDHTARHPSKCDGLSGQGAFRDQAKAAKANRKKQTGAERVAQQGTGTGDSEFHDNIVAETQERGLAYPSNVLKNIGRNKEALGHGAAFPVALPDFFILAYSDPGDLIVDPFLGSGSTAIAAAQRDRRSAGIEVSPRYVDVCRRRLTKWLKAHGLSPGPGVLEEAAI